MVGRPRASMTEVDTPSTSRVGVVAGRPTSNSSRVVAEVMAGGSGSDDWGFGGVVDVQFGFQSPLQ